MELTKETLREFLDSHPAVSPRALSIEAGLNPMYINQLYNSGKSLTDKAIEKLLPVLEKYGWK